MTADRTRVVERTGVIAAPSDAVWAALADFGGISAWAPNVDHSCLMSDHVEGVGATRRIQIGSTTLVETVTTWEPAATLAYRITGLPPVVGSVTNTWRIGASGASTIVLLTTVIDTGSRPPQRLIATALGRRMAAASEQMIDGLTSWIEAHEQEVDR